MSAWSPRNWITLGVTGVVVLFLAWLAALPGTASGWEEALFRPINDLPDWLADPTWPVMQMGAFAFVPVAALGVSVIWRRWHLTVAVLTVGLAGWATSKTIKTIVGRGRPDDLLTDVNVRPDWGGLGFVSGHTTIAFALATVIAPQLNRTGKVVVYGAAIATGFLRMYTGAHMPLDVIGGVGLGIILGSLARLALTAIDHEAAGRV